MRCRAANPIADDDEDEDDCPHRETPDFALPERRLRRWSWRRRSIRWVRRLVARRIIRRVLRWWLLLGRLPLRIRLLLVLWLRIWLLLRFIKWLLWFL